jgi:hypothetical protein
MAKKARSTDYEVWWNWEPKPIRFNSEAEKILAGCVECLKGITSDLKTGRCKPDGHAKLYRQALTKVQTYIKVVDNWLATADDPEVP